MLKTLRREAVEKPWILGTLFGGLAVLFVFGMGWWGFGQAGRDIVADVGSRSLSLGEYQRAYQNTLNQYRSALGDRFSSEMEKQLNLRRVSLEQSINRLLWIQYAERLGLTVSDAELKRAIMDVPVFRQAGRFDPEYYKHLLASNQMRPEQFEKTIRDDILVERAQALVGDSVALTSEEIAQAQKIAAEKAGKNKSAPPDLPRLVQSRILAQKKSLAIEGFTTQLRKEYKVTIKPEYLS